MVTDRVCFAPMRATLCLSICLAVACGHPSGPSLPSSPWSAPALFADIPADTPYVVAAIDPLDEALRARMYRGVGNKLAQLIANTDKLVRDEDEPWKRAVSAVVDSLRGTNFDKWYDTVGFGPSPRFAIYGLGIYPVFRVELADASKLRAIASKAITAAGAGIATNSLRGTSYWSIVESSGTIVMAVLDHELVVAFVPTVELQVSLPLILGLDHPAHSLADTMTVPDTLKKYGFKRTAFIQIDFARVGAALAALPGSPIASPECKDDFARLASYTPRMVGGYRHLDASGYAVGFVVETSPAIAGALAKLRTAMPQMPREGTPMFEMAAGIDVDAAVDAVRTAIHELRNQPFRCPALAPMSESLDNLAQKLDEPLPREMQGLRGFDFVIDDLSESPPSGKGALLVIGSKLGEAMKKLVGRSPLPLPPIPNDGSPVDLPVNLLGLPDVQSADIAVRDDVAALAVDPKSKERVTKALAAPADPHAPFMSFAWDVARTIERFPTVWKGDTLETMRDMKHVDMTLELRDDALDFEMDAGWP
jgi:hypothetical protein